MGKSLIIKGANFSSVSVGQVEFVEVNYEQFSLSRGLYTGKIFVANPTVDTFGTFITHDNKHLKTNIYYMTESLNVPVGKKLKIKGVQGLALQIAGYSNSWNDIDNAQVADYKYDSVNSFTTNGIAGDDFVWVNNTVYENFCIAFVKSSLYPNGYNTISDAIEHPENIMYIIVNN